MYFDEILTHTFVTDIKFWLNSIDYDLNSDILRLLIVNQRFPTFCGSRHP